MAVRSLFACVCALACLRLAAESTQGGVVYSLDNEVVCRVNSEAISKRDVEERMEEVAIRLYGMRKRLEMANQWNEQYEKQWNDMYIPPFRDALRKVVRDRLMIQFSRTENPPITVDERRFRQRYEQIQKRLQENGAFGTKGFTKPEVEKKVREQLLLEEFRGRLFTVIDLPSRRECLEYYEANPNKFEQKAGVKVRMIRIDRFITDPISGKVTARERAWETAEELRKDVAEYGADFAAVARIHTDDLPARERGGLIVLDQKDVYVDPASYNAEVANAVRGLEPGQISKVFQFGQKSFAFVMVEDKRPAGVAPFDRVYDEIYKFLSDTRSRRSEDEWFRKALAKSFVASVHDGKPTVLPIDFFFPEEAEQKAGGAAKDAKKETASGTPKL